MKAIILSAGQGKRLFPLTENTPKCLLALGSGTTLLSWQLNQLAQAGIKEAVVVTGYQAQHVEQEIDRCRNQLHIRTIYNPDYATSDNLRSVWHAREEMTGDFILLNGDTLFTADVVTTLMASPPQPITVTTARKDRYDSDDMKVKLKDGLLHAIGKTLDLDSVDAESIGMIRFQGEGVAHFRSTVERIVESGKGDAVWYLSVIDTLAKLMDIHITTIPGENWCEVDFPVDLQRARSAITQWAMTGDQGLEAAAS
ncbi:nucleotidyltransferase [Iodidimonas gelatinilytica]|uniref:Nucleotidyltransferase n=1 Tax=Iodidimonas gelatinilytica TaxID=1236966 RepID=A0A5A7MM95_9PROT|nr:phosphocholine cytidylyltransferase family protein [Iodidimonas gelatinilytica]GEQ97142.1 nucleotidyltransferase [Iodidimonas gelatinilytica]